MSVPSSELGQPTPSPASECVPPGIKEGCNTRLREGEGVGGPNSDDWRESLALCLLCGRPSVFFYSIYCSQQ